MQSKNRISLIYSWLYLISPWVILAGMLQYHFRSFLPYQKIFSGLAFFDFISFTDLFVGLIFVIFLIGIFTKKLQLQNRKLPGEWKAAVLLLLLAGVIQLIYQKTYEPVLSTPFEYFRSLFIFPLIFAVLAFKTLDKKTVRSLVKSYLSMVLFFCTIALFQYITGIFPGEQKDFMGRLVWPFIDFITLKSSSANWAAFFVTPAFIISFILSFQTLTDSNRKKLIRKWDFRLYGIVFLFAGVVLYLTQSYGGYVASFVAIIVYFFRFLPLKKLLIALVVMVILAGGAYLHQQTTWKYQVLTDQVEYRFVSSAASRADIYKMNFSIIFEHPVLGVGLNQYQSYFNLNQLRVLGHKLNESHIPPHAHNFFMSFWSNLGVLGFAAMFILILGIFLRTRLDPVYPFVFALTAIMAHGLIDSWYWKQETAYFFWLVVTLSYIYKIKPGNLS